MSSMLLIFPSFIHFISYQLYFFATSHAALYASFKWSLSLSCISFGNGVHSTTFKGDIYGAQNQYLHIVFLDNGSIEQSNFSQCICDGVEVVYMKQYNYLINEKNAMIKEVTYSNCKATENVGTAKWRIDDDR